MRGMVAFVIGWVLSCSALGAWFLISEWDTLTPSWERLSTETIVIAAFGSVIGGLVASAINVALED